EVEPLNRLCAALLFGDAAKRGHSNHLAATVEYRTAGVAPRRRCIHLHDLRSADRQLETRDAASREARLHLRSLTEERMVGDDSRIARDIDVVAEVQLAGIPEGHRRQVPSLDLD